MGSAGAQGSGRCQTSWIFGMAQNDTLENMMDGWSHPKNDGKLPITNDGKYDGWFKDSNYQNKKYGFNLYRNDLSRAIPLWIWLKKGVRMEP